MGRTTPTYRDRLTALEAEWADYRRTLRYADQDHFDALLEQGRAHADAAGTLNHPSPEIPLIISILLEHERRLSRLETRCSEAGRTPDGRES